MTLPPIDMPPAQRPLAERGEGTYRASSPKGLAQVPDGFERMAPSQENPPSLFKKFLFQPMIELVKWALRQIFTFFDFLRRASFDETPLEPSLERQNFSERLRSAPRPDQILRQFTKLYSIEEQNRIYLAIGQSHSERVSWKEMIFERTVLENIDLGRQLVRQNPLLLRDFFDI